MRYVGIRLPSWLSQTIHLGKQNLRKSGRDHKWHAPFLLERNEQRLLMATFAIPLTSQGDQVRMWRDTSMTPNTVAVTIDHYFGGAKFNIDPTIYDQIALTGSSTSGVRDTFGGWDLIQSVAVAPP